MIAGSSTLRKILGGEDENRVPFNTVISLWMWWSVFCVCFWRGKADGGFSCLLGERFSDYVIFMPEATITRGWAGALKVPFFHSFRIEVVVYIHATAVS